MACILIFSSVIVWRETQGRCPDKCFSNFLNHICLNDMDVWVISSSMPDDGYIDSSTNNHTAGDLLICPTTNCPFSPPLIEETLKCGFSIPGYLRLARWPHSSLFFCCEISFLVFFHSDVLGDFFWHVHLHHSSNILFYSWIPFSLVGVFKKLPILKNENKFWNKNLKWNLNYFLMAIRLNLCYRNLCYFEEKAYPAESSHNSLLICLWEGIGDKNFQIRLFGDCIYWRGLKLA